MAILFFLEKGRTAASIWQLFFAERQAGGSKLGRRHHYFLEKHDGGINMAILFFWTKAGRRYQCGNIVLLEKGRTAASIWQFFREGQAGGDKVDGDGIILFW